MGSEMCIRDRLGQSYRTLWGEDFLDDTLCGLTFRISVPSFYQVNRDQCEVLYQKAVELARLSAQGYRPRQALAVDMFPRTAHVETVVLLSKGEIDSKKIRVEFSLEDMDTSGFQQGATYEQIKGRVLEQTELKVSSLYISQIKRKCGLEVGQSYNLSKKENAKQPQCPPEKEAAIMEALKYFGMI